MNAFSASDRCIYDIPSEGIHEIYFYLLYFYLLIIFRTLRKSLHSKRYLIIWVSFNFLTKFIRSFLSGQVNSQQKHIMVSDFLIVHFFNCYFLQLKAQREIPAIDIVSVVVVNVVGQKY